MVDRSGTTPKPGPLSPWSRLGPLGPLELKRKISVKRAAELNDVSEDTFRRHYRHLIIKVSPRRDAVELGDAIALPPPPDTS
jgi:hypothetical protein